MGIQMWVIAGSLAAMTLSCALIVKQLVKVMTQYSYMLDAETGRIIDTKVDEICNKAVIISEDHYRVSSLQGDNKQTAIITKAEMIISDVLMHQGINPKGYNLTALVGCARFKLGFDKINIQENSHG